MVSERALLAEPGKDSVLRRPRTIHESEYGSQVPPTNVKEAATQGGPRCARGKIFGSRRFQRRATAAALASVGHAVRLRRGRIVCPGASRNPHDCKELLLLDFPGAKAAKLTGIIFAAGHQCHSADILRPNAVQVPLVLWYYGFLVGDERLR